MFLGFVGIMMQDVQSEQKHSNTALNEEGFIV